MENDQPEATAAAKHEEVLDLSFVPTWARQPPGVNPYAQHDGHDDRPAREPREDRPRRDDRRSGGPRRDARSGPGGGRPSRFGQRPGPGGGGGNRPERRFEARPDQEGQDRRDYRDHRPAPPPRMPVRVSFIPERQRLAAVVHDIQVTRRAYSLMDIAARFLAHPEAYLVKFESLAGEDGKPRVFLLQCDECRALFDDREAAQRHVIGAHLDKYFTVEEIQTEPPAGNFVVVAKCRLSGEILGPPNYHGYNERLQTLWRERFANMTLDEYRSRIETLRDPALIEQWKDSLRKQTVYKLKEQPDAAPMSRREAEAWMAEHKARALVRSGPRASVPAVVAQRLDNPALARSVREAWQRESKFPFTLSLALRPAFRHMHLHLFKVNKNETYVSAVHPHPLDPEKAVPNIREVLVYVGEHPGCNRHQLLEGLRPGCPPESPEAAAVLSPLRYLIDKGHVIEFFNGTLATPRGQAGHEPAPAAEAVTEPAAPEPVAPPPAPEVEPVAIAPAVVDPAPDASGPVA